MKLLIWKLICLTGLFFLSLQTSIAQVTDTIYHIRNVEITGNRKTKDFIITRELDLVENDTIGSKSLKTRLERNQQRVYNTRLFVYAKINPTFEGDQVDIEVEVKENWYIGGGINFKLIDRNFNEWWNERDRDLSRVIYGVSLLHGNFRGRREKLRLIAQTGFSDRFLINYDIPYLDKNRKTGIQIQAKYRGFKNVAYNTEGNKLLFTGQQENEIKTQLEGLVQLRRRQGFYTTHRLQLTYSLDRVADTLISLNPFYHQQGNLTQRFSQLGYVFTYDTRDNVNYPVKGQVIEGYINKRGLLPTDNVSSFQLGLGGGYYWALTNRWSMGLVSKFELTFPRNIPFNQMQGIGYEEEFLRGFDLYVINGTTFGLGKSNIRFKLLDKIIPLKFVPIKQFNKFPLAGYINFFADAGYSSNRVANREYQNNLSNQMLSSVGVGLDVIALLNTTLQFNLSRNSIGQTNLFLNLQKDF